MVIGRNEMKTETREKMRGGEGNVKFVHLAEAAKENHTRILAEITLDPGCSVGYHDHQDETEYYFFLSGTGIANDNGKEITVNAGDSMITGNGASHGVKNTGNVPLVFHAVIITN